MAAETVTDNEPSGRRLRWSADDIPDLDGRVYVVTGGNRGVGFAIARMLAGRGAMVVIGCRDLESGAAARAKIGSADARAEVDCVQLDLASLASVREFADHIVRGVDHLDGLINNAGVMMPPMQLTADGFELQFGTNVLGHYALTGHLMPLMEASAGARVVSISSLVHWFARIDLGNLNAERRYDPMRAYMQSKLATLVFANELQRRLAGRESRVASVGAHPGITRSELARHSRAVQALMPVVAQPTEAGALPAVIAATAREVRGGDYIGPCGFLTMRGEPGIQKTSARSRDEVVGAQLWEAAEKLTGVRYL